MSTKELTKEVNATWRGIKRVFTVTVGVVEAIAWLGLILFAWVNIFEVFKNTRAMNDVLFAGLIAVTLIISLRAAYEFAAYLRRVGNEYER
jgi:hypothetical protein